MTNQKESRRVVLVADDDPGARLVISSMLEHESHQVLEASNGREAVDLFQRSRADLVILDVMMPGMNGHEACAAIRRCPGGGDTPILILTGLDDTETISRAYEAGATDFASKPISRMILSHRVRYMMRAARTLADLRRSESRLEEAQRIALIGHWERDLLAGRMDCSEQLLRILGLGPARSSLTFAEYLELLHPDDRGPLTVAIEEAMTGGCEQGPYSLDYRVLRPDGTVRHVHDKAKVFFDGSGRAVRIAGTTQDITERKKAEEQIRALAYYDTLTRLPNRTLFMDRLNVSLEIARRRMRKVALLFLDLDRFKRINDTLGHAWGDEILRQTAARLSQCIRSCDAIVRGNPQADIDTVARLAGDEFVMSIGDISRVEDAIVVAGRIQSVLSEPYVVDGREIVITASMGISIYPDDGNAAEMVLKHADIALHHAKLADGGDYRFFRESMNEAASQRLNMEGHLSKALGRGEFALHYQPVVDLVSRKVIGAEALLRWNQRDLGPVSPTTFIPLAEETGLIMPIGEWVLRSACAQARSWDKASGGCFRISVNISARQLRDRLFLESVPEILKETGLAAAGLEIEITESCLMEDTRNASRLLTELRKLGVRVSIDDFGTGYSSLSYLSRLPVDTLKIDRSFVQGLMRGRRDVAVTQAIITMGEGMGLAVIAEGIEHERQLAILRGQGCRLAQGFLLAMPMPAEEFARMIGSTIDVGASEVVLARR